MAGRNQHYRLAAERLVEADPFLCAPGAEAVAPLDPELPFDLRDHKDVAGDPIAQATLARVAQDVRWCHRKVLGAKSRCAGLKVTCLFLKVHLRDKTRAFFSIGSVAVQRHDMASI